MPAPNTGSLLENNNGNNNTGTGLSTQIIIEVNGNPVGAIKTISYDESRSVAMISEVGTDGHIDSAPQKSTDYTGDCTRTVFDRMHISESFSRGFVHLKSQRVPFNIIIKDIFAGDEAKAVVTTLKNVWITKLGKKFDSENFINFETMSFTFEDIYSTLGTSASNAATGGSRGIALELNSIERSADIGGRRGSLDAAALVSAYFGDIPNA